MPVREKFNQPDVMTTQTNTPRWWLLLARGLLYILMGIALFVFGHPYTVQSGQIIGVLLALAGAAQLAFSYTNRGPENNPIWGVIHGLTDVAFGAVILVYSSKLLNGFIDSLGFWAMLFAFLQAVQTMYSFLAARATTSGAVPSKFIHVGNVLTAAAMSYVLLSLSADGPDSLGFIGLFPIILGVLVIILTQQVRAQMVSHHKHELG